MRKFKDFIDYMFIRYVLLKARLQNYLLGNKKNKKEEDEWFL